MATNNSTNNSLNLNVDASTGPGTDPVVPDNTNTVNITGAQVAAGTTANAIRTDSTAANSLIIEIQKSKTEASTTAASNGISHFDSSAFTVDANGFVTMASTLKITTYNTSDSPATWTKSARTQFVEVFGWGGGCGGGSGRKGTSTASSGGGGGPAGDAFHFYGPATFFGATESVTIGAGGTGGAAQTTNATNGNDGNPGGNTSFGDMLVYGGGQDGSPAGGGTTQDGDPGAYGSKVYDLIGNTSVDDYLDGNGSNEDGTARVDIGPGHDGDKVATDIYAGSLAGTGGGGGGGADIITERSGGNGSNYINVASTVVLAGGTGGLESTGINGGNGTVPKSSGGICSGGTGGGGGGGYSIGAGSATSGGKGGNGAIPGGGGGGGGGGLDAVANSGAGGDGGNGRVIVIEYF